jgi:putative ABC transport system ATP-binding protein
MIGVDILKEQTTSKLPQTSPPPLVGEGRGGGSVITISDLRFWWSQTTPIVLDIEAFQIQQGERVFISGPSGSGKSTLLSLLAGVVTPQQGQVNVLGQRIDQLNSVKRDHFRSDHIGFIFQMFNLIPYLSVVENVTLPCQFSKRRKAKVLRRTSSLKEEALRLLAHLDMADQELLTRPVTDLSVGQQQRVAAARALIGAPEIVIADEPTSSLDADRREGFVKLLFQECQQEATTLVFVSHDVFLESFFDRTIRLAEVNRA